MRGIKKGYISVFASIIILYFLTVHCHVGDEDVPISGIIASDQCGEVEYVNWECIRKDY